MTKLIPATAIGNVAHWTIIEVWEDDIPPEIFKALTVEAARKNGHVYTLMWDDLFFYRGEDGWCLDEVTLEIAGAWLEEQRCLHHITGTKPIWFRIQRSS